MAFNAMLALRPAILTLRTAIGFFQPGRSAFDQVTLYLSTLVPLETLGMIEDFSQEVKDGRNHGLFSLSFILSLWTASAITSAAMNALDEIHQVPLNQRRSFWRTRVVAIGLTLGTVTLLLVASALIFVSGWVFNRIAYQSSWFTHLLMGLSKVLYGPLALTLVAIAFAFLYRYGPSHRFQGEPLLPGAVLASLAWAGLSSLFRYYVIHFSDYNMVYGTVGAVIILMLWLDLTALAMLLGSQINVTVGAAMGSRQLRNNAHVDT